MQACSIKYNEFDGEKITIFIYILYYFVNIFTVMHELLCKYSFNIKHKLKLFNSILMRIDLKFNILKCIFLLNGYFS